jgi:hypothetical protein
MKIMKEIKVKNQNAKVKVKSIKFPYFSFFTLTFAF